MIILRQCSSQQHDHAMLMHMSRTLIAAVKHLIEVDERPFSTTNKLFGCSCGSRGH